MVELFSHLRALYAACGKLIFVAPSAVNVLLARNKRFGSDGRLADDAAETLFVPLARFVFHLFRAWNDEEEVN